MGAESRFKSPDSREEDKDWRKAGFQETSLEVFSLESHMPSQSSQPLSREQRLFWWTARWAGSLLLVPLVVFGHQYWISATLKAHVAAGGIDDPDVVFTGEQAIIFVGEAAGLLISMIGFGVSMVRWLIAVDQLDVFRTKKSRFPFGKRLLKFLGCLNQLAARASTMFTRRPSRSKATLPSVRAKRV